MPDQVFTVREAAPEDFDAVRELTLTTYLGEGLGSPNYAPSLADVASRARDAELLVAVTSTGSGEEVVGSVAFAPWGSPYGEVLHGPDEAAFRMLAVAARWRGHGAGELLVRACLTLARARGCARVVISTESSMLAAHRMYARLGFVREPERDWSPHPGVDLMCLALVLGTSG